jgi:hypothetical protein
MKPFIPLISLLLLPGLIPQDYRLAGDSSGVFDSAYVDVSQSCPTDDSGGCTDDAADQQDDSKLPREGQHRPLAFGHYGSTKRVEELCKRLPVDCAIDSSCPGASHHSATRLERAGDTDDSQVQPQPFPAFCIQRHGPPTLAVHNSVVFA